MKLVLAVVLFAWFAITGIFIFLKPTCSRYSFRKPTDLEVISCQSHCKYSCGGCYDLVSVCEEEKE